MLANVKKWGNSYAIRLTVGDLKRLGLHEGDTVQVDVAAVPERDLSWLPVLHDDRSDVSENHDRYLYDWDRPDGP